MSNRVVEMTLTEDMGPNLSAPHSMEAEEAVVGACLMDPNAYEEVAWLLPVTDFYLHPCRWTWAAMASIRESGKEIDLLTVTDELERHGQLAEAGGVAWLTRLIDSVPTSLHVTSYAQIITREATRRRLLEAATQVAKLAYQEDKPIEQIVSEANGVLSAVYRDTNSHTMTLAEAGQVFLDRVKAVMADPDAYMGLPTGLVDLDALLGGLMPSDFVIVGGRPGAGKTALLSQIGKFNAARLDKWGQERRQPKRVVQFSLEMENAQLAMRAIAGDTAIEVQKLRLARLKPEDLPRLIKAVDDFVNYQLWYDDTPGLTISMLRAKCRKLTGEVGPLDLVIVDYLQIMASDAQQENRTQEVSKISRGLKALARELSCVVLAGAQLSRGVEHRADNKPVLSDLREGGSQEQEADTVILLSETDQKNLIRSEVAKQRNGMTGTVQLYLNKAITRFENAASGSLDIRQ